MDYEDYTEQDESAASSSANSYDDSNNSTRDETDDNDLGDHIGVGLKPNSAAQSFGSQKRGFHDFLFLIPYPITTQTYIANIMNNEGDCRICDTANEPFCHVKRDSLDKLKDSTRKLLCLLEELQSKTHSKILLTDEPPKLTRVLKPLNETKDEKCSKPPSVSDFIGANAMNLLETQTKQLGYIVIEDEDDCSVYKRLTRKCHCLNQREYNDFIIHFNEETKFCTNAIGEIIKNMRILKQFLYMGGTYTKNALMFLNEGLGEATHTEKVDMIQAIAFADVCNVFDQCTIVTVCINWTCKNENIIDPLTQGLAAGLLYKIAEADEGRSYLNLNSRIICDIKRGIKKKSSKIESEIIECLQSVLDLCQPPLDEQPIMTYYCRPLEEDLCSLTLNALVACRQYMSYDEVFLYLDKLHTMSSSDKGKQQLTSQLPIMLNLFRNMLLEFDDSGMNIIITNILNRIVAKNMIKEPNEGLVSQKLVERGTQPIPKPLKNVLIQIPIKKPSKKNSHNKSVLALAASKSRPQPATKVKEQLEDPIQQLKTTTLNISRRTINITNINTCIINRSRKFTKDNRNPTTIVVPLESK